LVEQLTLNQRVLGSSPSASTTERLSDLVAQIEGMGGEALAVATDVTDEAAVENLFAQAVARFGTVDVLINNAGIAENTPVDQTTLELWNNVMATNLTSAFLCSKHAWPVFRRGGHGRIVNVGSISAKVPRNNCPSYTASKFGLSGLTHALALDGRDDNIAVSIFHPGIVATEIMPGSVKLPENFAATPEEAAGIIVHMCDMPDHLNFYEALMVQNKLPFLGRG
jgi:NAD(P)-dependent dehydrogenase (short-subunit alcohol dehydrogenase family)